MDRAETKNVLCYALLAMCAIFCAYNNKVAAQTIIKNDSIKPYIHFLENNQFLSAKEYILSKFETYDIVVLSERHHWGIPNIYPKEYEEHFFYRIALNNNQTLEEAMNDEENIEYLKKINTPV